MSRSVSRPVRRVLLVVAAGMLLVGCALSQRFRFERPSVELAQVVVTGLGLTGGTLDLVFDVHNPNTYDLHTTRLEVAIALEETPFGEILLERALTLPREADTQVTVPLRFTWEGVGAGARGLITRGSVHYGLEGRMYVDTPAGNRAVTLAGDGLVSLRDLTR